jgi:cytochrome c oxidase subunit IV
LVGLRIRWALISLGFVLIVVTFGHLLKEPLYPFHEHVIPRLALLLFVLMLPVEDDRFSLDHLLNRGK